MKILPNIPVAFKGKFPKGYINNVEGFALLKNDIKESKGKLVIMDIDFGNYCSLNCPHCFRQNNKADTKDSKMMQYDDIIDVIKQGKKLGLKYVKFLGAGEPFEDKRFLEFLRDLKKMNIVPLIFTKGHVIGDDNLVKKWYSEYGITTGRELVKELHNLNAIILLGFNSFDDEKQDKMVGNVRGYTRKRNLALEILVEEGFNGHHPTRIMIAANPITHENYGEMLEMYKWARVRNMCTIMCPTMVSGRCGDEKSWKKITPSREELIDLYTKIYLFNIERGIQTLEQIEEEGISSYAGMNPCNQVACGMYVTLSGTVLRCPGDDVTVFGNIWNESIKNIWEKSENFERAGTFNCQCPPKMGKTFPDKFFEDVLANLKSKVA